jgi:hypothetical protein
MIYEENSSESPPEGHTPFKDLTNCETGEQEKSKYWYNRMSAHEKEEYLHKQRIARQQKKAETPNHEREQGTPYHLKSCPHQIKFSPCIISALFAVINKQEIVPRLVTYSL